MHVVQRGLPVMPQTFLAAMQASHGQLAALAPSLMIQCALRNALLVMYLSLVHHCLEDASMEPGCLLVKLDAYLKVTSTLSLLVLRECKCYSSAAWDRQIGDQETWSVVDCTAISFHQAGVASSSSTTFWKRRSRL